ncbi:unnamed protein product [Merluccius merluccius]
MSHQPPVDLRFLSFHILSHNEAPPHAVALFYCPSQSLCFLSHNQAPQHAVALFYCPSHSLGWNLHPSAAVQSTQFCLPPTTTVFI